MRQPAITIVFYLLCHLTLVQGHTQTAISTLTVTNNTAATTSNTNNGWNAAAPYPTSTSYTHFYGQRNGGASGIERTVTSFTIGAASFIPKPRPGGKPFDNVVINRHPLLPGDTINSLYEYTTSSGTNLYYEPSYLPNLEDVINSFVCNRGSDNLFSNTPSTQANIERVDLIVTGGITCVAPASQGFLINERNGNDPFKVAAITTLNGSNLVNSLGSLVNIVTPTNWGRVGPSFVSRVMSRRTGSDVNLRAKQDIASQQVSGVFISFASLGIPVGTRIYGLSLFPNDVTSAMNLVTLTNVPTNTDGNTAGGLDMMAGGGYFVEASVLSVQLEQFTGSSRGNDVLLNWKAPGQENAIGFELERSSGNSGQFTRIATIPALAGTEASYSYTDKAAPRNGVQYYRLRIRENGEADRFSSVVAVRLQRPNSAAVAPNVVQQGVTVMFTGNNLPGTELIIRSSAGQVVQRIRLSGTTGSTQVATGQLSPGVYFLQMQSEEGMQTCRLVVQ